MRNTPSFYWATVKVLFLPLLSALISSSCSTVKQNKQAFNADLMMIRMAEIEIDTAYLDEYIPILKEEAAASVKLEPGVICIYPMFQKEKPAQIRLLEIYASKEAYETHLKTPHFLHYKTATLHMVKSLKLIDMEAIDEVSMPEIFYKLKN